MFKFCDQFLLIISQKMLKYHRNLDKLRFEYIIKNRIDSSIQYKMNYRNEGEHEQSTGRHQSH